MDERDQGEVWVYRWVLRSLLRASCDPLELSSGHPDPLLHIPCLGRGGTPFLGFILPTLLACRLLFRVSLAFPFKEDLNRGPRSDTDHPTSRPRLLSSGIST